LGEVSQLPVKRVIRHRQHEHVEFPLRGELRRVDGIGFGVQCVEVRGGQRCDDGPAAPLSPSRDRARAVNTAIWAAIWTRSAFRAW
jgi:hypothetical protein